MYGDAKKWIKVRRKGRMKGVEIYLDQETWEMTLKNSNIPTDTPLDNLRVTRYFTKSRNIIIRVKHIDKIPIEDR